MPRSIAGSVRLIALILAFAIAVPGPKTMAAGPELADREALATETFGLMVDQPGTGQAEAMLGILYLRGAHLSPDPVAAAAWLARSAASGHPAGVYAAARIYAEGIGVAREPDRARRLLESLPLERFGPLVPAVRQLRLSLDLDDGSNPAAKPRPTVPAAAAAGAPVAGAPVAGAAGRETAPTTGPAPGARPLSALVAASAPGASPPAMAATAPSLTRPVPPVVPVLPAETLPAETLPADTLPPDTLPTTALAPLAPIAAPAPGAPRSESVVSPAPAGGLAGLVPALPATPRFQIIAGRMADREDLEQLNRRLTRRHGEQLAGIDRIIAPVADAKGRQAYQLTFTGFDSLDQAKRTCALLNRGPKSCAAGPAVAPADPTGNDPAAEPAPPAILSPAGAPGAAQGAASTDGSQPESDPGLHAVLATLASEADAAAERARVQPFLPSGDAVVRPAQLSGARTVWRVIVPNFANRADADAYCERASARGLYCRIRR